MISKDFPVFLSSSATMQYSECILAVFYAEFYDLGSVSWVSPTVLLLVHIPNTTQAGLLAISRRKPMDLAFALLTPKAPPKSFLLPEFVSGNCSHES